MTDNEIKKALECCIAPNCADCPIFTKDDIRKDIGRCVHFLEENALDLINRQQAEIERLEKVQVQYVKAYFDEFTERLKSDFSLSSSTIDTVIYEIVDELTETIKKEFGTLADFTDLIKSEAIKEFIEKCVLDFCCGRGDNRCDCYICENDFLEIMKEMMGDTE